MQKEVAERICAKPGKLSILALSVQVYGEPEIAGYVDKSSFYPEPKVDTGRYTPQLCCGWDKLW